jgi:hypothetical protein
MTTVNGLNDQSNESLKLNLNPVRRTRVGLAIAVAGLAVALTGFGGGILAAGAMAPGHGTHPRDVVVGNENRPQAPEVHGQLVDDWPWTPQVPSATP